MSSRPEAGQASTPSTATRPPDALKPSGEEVVVAVQQDEKLRQADQVIARLLNEIENIQSRLAALHREAETVLHPGPGKAGPARPEPRPSPLLAIFMVAACALGGMVLLGHLPGPLAGHEVNRFGAVPEIAPAVVGAVGGLVVGALAFWPRVGVRR